MRGLLKHPMRVTARLAWLAAELLWAAFRFIFVVKLRGNDSSRANRAQWLQAACQRVLRVFHAELRVTGAVPQAGLLVANHLSYVDIFVLGALAPSVFVAKSEVRNWPVLGRFACLAGTLFADRERRAQVGPLAGQLRSVLQHGALVILFPEGTSSGGATVLPFKSALLQPAANSELPLSAACLEYQLEDGDASEEVCYWKDMVLVPHLLNLLSKPRLKVTVRFSAGAKQNGNRKELARQLRSEVLKLKAPWPVPASELPSYVMVVPGRTDPI